MPKKLQRRTRIPGSMKFKKKRGPHEFIFWMNFKVKAPRVNKLLMKREGLKEQLRYQPEKSIAITKKIIRIDLELKRYHDFLSKLDIEIEYRKDRILIKPPRQHH